MYNSNTFSRAEVRVLSGYDSGLSIEAVREKYGIQRVAKLGSNENPLGVSPKALEALTFIFFPSPLVVDSVNASLLRQGVIIKPWFEHGYQQYLRVSVGSREYNDMLLHALEKVFHH